MGFYNFPNRCEDRGKGPSAPRAGYDSAPEHYRRTVLAEYSALSARGSPQAERARVWPHPQASYLLPTGDTARAKRGSEEELVWAHLVRNTGLRTA
jgi:hypothetical protein